MGLALHCHGQHKLTKGRMEEKGDTKRKKELFPIIFLMIVFLILTNIHVYLFLVSLNPQPTKRPLSLIVGNKQLGLNYILWIRIVLERWCTFLGERKPQVVNGCLKSNTKQMGLSKGIRTI